MAKCRMLKQVRDNRKRGPSQHDESRTLFSGSWAQRMRDVRNLRLELQLQSQHQDCRNSLGWTNTGPGPFPSFQREEILGYCRNAEKTEHDKTW
jgi:hypothetical protein